jgi:hypothetical protein
VCDGRGQRRPHAAPPRSEHGSGRQPSGSMQTGSSSWARSRAHHASSWSSIPSSRPYSVLGQPCRSSWPHASPRPPQRSTLECAQLSPPPPRPHGAVAVAAIAASTSSWCMAIVSR